MARYSVCKKSVFLRPRRPRFRRWARTFSHVLYHFIPFSARKYRWCFSHENAAFSDFLPENCRKLPKTGSYFSKRWALVLAEKVGRLHHGQPALQPRQVGAGQARRRCALEVRFAALGQCQLRLRELSADGDIRRLAYTFEAFQQGTLEDEKGFCAVVTTAQIAGQDYILTPGRYVGIAETEDDGEPFDEKVARITGELPRLFARSHELEEEIKKQLGGIGVKF